MDRAKGRIFGISFDHIVILLTVPVVIFLAFAAGRKILETYALKQEAAAIQLEIDQLKARNAELRRQIDYLRSDGYVEKIAREELDLVYPGDVSFVVSSKPANQQPQVQAAAQPPQPRAAPNQPQGAAVPWRDSVPGGGR